MLNNSFEAISRRSFIKGGLMVATAATLGMPSAAKAENHSTPNPDLDIYMPTWLTPDEYGKIQDLKLQNVSRFILSFALPESDGSISLPAISSDLSNLLKSSSPHTKVGLSVGGWGDSDAQHASNLKGFGAAINNPKVFVESAKKAIDKLGIDQIDIDIEFPTAHQAGKPLSEFTQKLRKGLPSDVSIAMAVSAYRLSNPTIADYEFGDKGLAVDTFHVMTYDENGGTGNQPAGYVASGEWTINCINEWVKRVGDASKISVGYPTYGYMYTGATKAGDQFKTATEVLYPQAPASAIDNNYKELTTTGMVGKNEWASFLSPSVIHATQKRILEAHPNIGGAFLWSAEGLEQAHLDALAK